MRPTFLLPGATALALSGLMWTAQAQPQGAEDEAGVPPQVHIGGVKVPARVGGGGGAVGAPAAVGLTAEGVAVPGAAGTRAALVAQAVRAGLVSWEGAWQSGQMGRAEVLELLAEWPLRSRVVAGTSHAEDIEVRRQLGALLVSDLKSEADLEQSRNWSAGARMVLATALVEAGDARAVALLEELWRERPLAERGPYTFFIIEQLAHFYSNAGQHEKAAQTWLRMTQVEPRNAKQMWWKPGAMIEAARVYVALGEQSKAKELYAQVPQYGQGWMSALSLYDQAQPLINAGKLDEARELMSQPLVFTEAQTDGVIAQNAWLASLAYQQGDLDAALRYGEKVREAAKAGKSSGASVNNLAQMGLDIYNRAGGWRTQPIQTETKEIIFEINPNEPNRTQYKRFRIKTYGDTSITATVDNPAFQASVLPINNWRREGLNAHEQEMEVVVQTSLNRPMAGVPLILSSAARSKTTTVRLSLREESPRPALSTGG